jgi:GGDEF domain-containing protein
VSKRHERGPIRTYKHEGGIYAVQEYPSGTAELLTQRFDKQSGRKTWESARNQPEGSTLEAVLAEAERRTKWHVDEGAKREGSAPNAGAALPAAAPAAQLERRKDLGRRRRVDEMSREEMRRELLTSTLTGIGNRRAYEESQKLPIQVMADADSLKWVNDNMGHESGDKMLRAIGEAIAAETQNGFHLSGDEFVVQAKTHLEADAIMARVRSRLAEAVITITLPDGGTRTLKGIGLSYGKGPTVAEADSALNENKAAREESGERSGRGSKPPGATEKPAERLEGQERELAQAPAETVAPRNRSEKQAARDELLRRQALGRKTLHEDKDSVLTAVIKLGGIKDTKENRLELTGDTRMNPRIGFVGYLFRKSGRGIDEMATWLGPDNSRGYISKEESGDVDGGVQALKDKVRDELGGRPHYSHAFDHEAARRQTIEQAEAVAAPDLLTADIEEFVDAVAPAAAIMTLDADATIRRAGVVDDGEVEAILERAAMRAENGEDYERAIQEEIAARTAGAGGEGAAQNQGEEAGEGFALAGQTNAEILANERAAAAKSKAAEKEAAAAKQDALRDEIKMRSFSAADTFELGQSAERNLAATNDMFSAPAAKPVPEVKPVSDGKSRRMTYDQAVAENMRAMGSSLDEWTAVEIEGMSVVPISGGVKPMPVFKFPSGYSPAPSIFQGGGSCELCGTPIKNYYWIQNDKKRWTMPVGSECVTHFSEGKSGEELAKETKDRINKQLLADAEGTRRALRREFYHEAVGQWGRRHWEYDRSADGQEAKRISLRLKEIIGTHKSEDLGAHNPASTPGAITRWANKHKDEVTDLIRDGKLLAEKAESARPRVEEPAAEYAARGERTLSNLNKEEKGALDAFLKGRKDGSRIRGNLKRFKDTPWAKQSLEGILTRQAIEMVMRGETPRFYSAIDSDRARIVRRTLERGEDGLWSLLEGSGGRMIGSASKPVNSVSSSFINCDPSLECATYCYAAAPTSNYRFPSGIVKSELVTMAVERDPVRAADQVAREYKATIEFKNNVALRLFDKGDGNDAWVPFIKELNRSGVRVQVFSKIPSFLRQVPDMNLRLLSVDDGSLGVADANKDLLVAYTYKGEEDTDALRALLARNQVGVVLPIKLGRKVFDQDQVRRLKNDVPGIGPYICPIDAGWKRVGPAHDTKGWNCTKCDANGHIGCFFGRPTSATMKSLEVRPTSPERKAEVIRRLADVRREIGEYLGGVGGPVAEDGRLPAGRPAELLREVDKLLGELLRGDDAGGEGRVSGGLAQSVAGVGERNEGAVRRPGRVIPIVAKERGAGEPWAGVEDPAGGNRRGPRRRADANVGQGDLFGDPYEKTEVRPGTTEEQKSAGRSAVDELRRRFGLGRLERLGNAGRGSASVLGSRLWRNFVAGKPNQLVGQKVDSSVDLAALAQVYRDPRFETFRVIYTDASGAVLSESGYTSRLPGAVSLPADLGDRIRAEMAASGAVGYWLLHNHPSGRAAPSQADIYLTKLTAQAQPGFKGHVVIDRNEYAEIDDDGGARVVKAPLLLGVDFKSNPEIPHPLLGEAVNSPKAVASLGRRLQVEASHATMILTDRAGEVQLIVDVPVESIAYVGRRKLVHLSAIVRKMGREAGAGGHRFLVLPKGSRWEPKDLKRYVLDGIVKDVVDAEGRSVQDALGVFERPASDIIDETKNRSINVKEGAGRYVFEDEPEYVAKPAFYSALHRAVQAANMRAAPADGWRQLIKGLVAKATVKVDEVEWSGINDWLALQQGKVTKEQVAQYMQQNGVRIEEVILGNPSSEFNYQGNEWQQAIDRAEADGDWALAERIGRAWEGVDEETGSSAGAPKFATYQLPGGKNYRELLLTLPVDDPDARVREWHDISDQLWGRLNDRERAALRQEYIENGEESWSRPKRTDDFRSSHYDQPNILAHIRFNERQYADGKRVLFIEEIQSDWGQKGRKDGFNAPVQMPDGSSRTATTGAPFAPFVGKTEAWVALALKRMIRYAVDNKFDRVAWTTGEQQAERYDLSKKISKVVAQKTTLSNRYEVKAYGLDANQVIADVYEESELPDVVGKELADRIVTATTKNPGKKVHFEGLDLKVGGEGIKAFYDKIVPTVAKGVLKKLGVGQVADFKFDPADLGENPDDYSAGGMRQPGFDITDEMRDKALSGMPLFKLGSGGGGMGRSAVLDAIKGILGRWRNAPEVVVVQSIGDLPFKAPARARGAFYQGKVYLVADNIRSAEDAQFVLLHETAGHYGLESILGDALEQAMRSIYDSNANVRAMADARIAQAAKNGLSYDIARATEEALADLAGQNKLGDVRGWRLLVAKIRAILRDLGFTLEMSDNDVAALLKRAADSLTDGADSLAGEEGKYSLRNVTFSPAFMRWFGGSKVVEPDGSPMVVYHGTRGDFSTFMESVYGEGFHFGTVRQANARIGMSPAALRGYKSGPGDHHEGANVMPVYLSIKNPIRLPDMDSWPSADSWLKRISEIPLDVRDDIRALIKDKVRSQRFYFMRSVIELLESKGYDGIVYQNEHEAKSARGKSWMAFKKEQIKSATANVGEFSPESPDIRFSLAGDYVEAGVNAVRDTLNNPKKFNWWHRTVGTQFHKAQAVPEFRPVFEAAQSYLQSVSKFAIDAADKAPSWLPRLAKFADVFSFGPRSADLAAVSRVIFDGTLNDRRPDAIALRNLTHKQRALYTEARAAIDLSIDQLAVSEMHKLAGDEDIDSARNGLQGRSLRDALGALQSALSRQAEALTASGDADAAARKEALIEQLEGVAERAERLKAEGYAPLMRFGQYSVDVTHVEQGRDGSPKVVRDFFGMYETAREAGRAARMLAREFPQSRVSSGTMDDESWKLYRGLSLDSLALFAESTGMTKHHLFQEFYKTAVNSRSALTRLIHRKGVAGFDEDMQRVLASFITSNARLASRNYHFGEMTKAAVNIPVGMGDVRAEAARLVEYVQNPIEEASGLRGLLFVNFLGGSVASALTNATQPIMMTLPFLSQFAGARAAGAALLNAAGIAAGRRPADAALRDALARASKEGITDPQELHQLYAESIRGLGSSMAVRRGLRVWGSMFSLAESFNRKVTFAAAFRLASRMPAAELRRHGVATPFDFAVMAVEDTQGIYNRGNRPNWARGPIGATVFTFKQYSIAYLEFLKRLPAKEKAIALSLLILAAGAQGLPGADDLEDIIDTIGQALGYNTNSKQAIREAAMNTLGRELGGLLLHGVSGLPGSPVDVQARLGMSNLIPGTGMLLRSSPDKAREIAEVIGPVGGIYTQASQGAASLLAGQYGRAAAAGFPVAIQNVMKGVDMAQSGYYKDAQGRKVVDTSGADAALKAIGAQPKDVATAQRAAGDAAQSIAMARVVEGQIADRWARGIIDKDAEAVRKAVTELREWNSRNPDWPIRITPAQIKARVQAAMLSRDVRLLKGAPPEVRRAVYSTLQGA